MKKLRNKILFGLAVISSFVFIGAGESYFEVSKNLDIFASLYRELNTYYVDDTKPGELMKTGIDAMLSSLDPYTNYIPEARIEDFRFMTTGQYGGIGALIRKQDDHVIIADIYEGFAAHEAGLMVGDKILEIDGESAKDKSTDEISSFLKGQPKTQIKIKVERGFGDEAKVMEKELSRKEIKIEDVPYSGMLSEDVGYIKLISFTQTASKELIGAMKKLKENPSLKYLVVDLRGNGGGLLRESVNIVNAFVDKGTVVVSTKGKMKEWDQLHKTLNNPVDTEIPVVILIDGGSASASEIVAGSLQDLDRAVVLGERSFGKALVQQTVDLSYNSKLKVTVAKYYTPSGRCLQKLDYSHRNENGEVESVPDSLRKGFKSVKYGRTFYDGKGVNPDITVAQNDYSNISYTLIGKSHIFNFVTRYHLKNEKIGPIEEFKLSDEVYQSFLSYIEDKDYSYRSESEDLLEEFKERSKKEDYYAEAEEEYHALKQIIENAKKQDLQRHESEIRELLSSEMIKRYYYQKGQIAYSLSQDEQVIQAVSLLQDQDRYKAILMGEAGGEKR